MFPLLLILVVAPAISQDVVRGIDDLVEVSSTRTVDLLGSEDQSVLAIYHFIIDGRRSGISGLLIDSLTTQIANLGRGRVKVVSRRVLDRIMEEQAFRISDLAERDSQLQVGNLLGADVILTGFITAVEDLFKLNAQIVEVDTGVVRGGFLLDFRLEDGLQAQVAATRTTTVVIEEEGPQVERGSDTVTTVLETFDHGMSRVPFDHSADSWGDRIIWSAGEVSLMGEGGPDDSACLRYTFAAEFDSDDLLVDWQDSDLAFYLNFRLPTPPEGSTGIHLDVRPAGFSSVEYYVRQSVRGNDHDFYGWNALNADEWQELKIPFDNFHGDDPGDSIDADRGMSLSVAVLYKDNYHRYHFRSGKEMTGELLVDNIGYYSVIGQDDPAVLDAFDDEIDRAMLWAEVYGSSVHTDYSEGDDGALRRTPGIAAQRITLRKKEDGPAARYLSIEVSLDVTDGFTSFMEQEETLGVHVWARIGKSWKGYQALSFFIRSSSLASGYLGVHGEGSDWYYGADLNANPIWTRVRIPFSELVADDTDLASSGEVIEYAHLSWYFDIPETALRRAIRKGSLDLTLDLDEIVLE